jgi:hypothetical protein
MFGAKLCAASSDSNITIRSGRTGSGKVDDRFTCSHTPPKNRTHFQEHKHTAYAWLECGFSDEKVAFSLLRRSLRHDTRARRVRVAKKQRSHKGL